MLIVETLYADGTAMAGATSAANAYGPPDGTYTTDTGNTSWTGRWALETPAGAEASGTHTITVRVRKEVGQSGNPVVDGVSLYHGGTSLASLTSGVSVTSDAGQDITGTFDAALLAGVDLAAVEVQVGTTSAGGNPNTRSAVQLDAITWQGAFVAPSAGGSAAGSVTWTGSADGREPPILLTPPANVQVTVVSATETAVQWDAVDKATGYDVERDGQLVGSVAAPPFTDSGLTPGEHTYRVRARADSIDGN